MDLWLSMAIRFFWQGSWLGDPSDVLLIPQEGITVPLGVGVTIPAIQIIEVLEQDKLKDRRKAERQKRDRKRAVS